MRGAIEYVLNPLIWAGILLPFALAADILIIVSYQADITPAFDAYLYGLLLLAAYWASLDSIKRKVYFPSDLLFLFFWVTFPAYLYESRQWRGIGLLLGLILGFIIIAIAYTTFTSYIFYSYFG